MPDHEDEFQTSHPVGSTFEHDGVTWTIEEYGRLSMTEGAGGHERTLLGRLNFKAVSTRGAVQFRVTGANEVEIV